jgi:CubicO group peptidase (beta-lactamase class C family)
MADLGELVAAARAELRLPALLAGVVAGGRLARWVAPGYAEVATRRRPTRRTAIRLASVSTVITALATHRLVDAGAVGLDAPVGDLLPTPALVSPNGRPVLVRHLLEHTAGVPTDPRLALGVPAESRVPDLADLVDAEIATLHAPGERFAHSPLGYALLGALVERVSGRPYDDAVVTGVLDPLGCRRTSFRLDDRVARQPLCAYEVDFDEALVATATDPVLRPAAGGISTLEDLGALAGALLDPARRSVVEPSAPTGVPGVATTLAGLLAGDLDGAAVSWHTGGWPGAVTGLYVAPDAGIGLVLAGNAFSPARLAGLDRLGLDLLSWLLPRVAG